MLHQLCFIPVFQSIAAESDDLVAVAQSFFDLDRDALDNACFDFDEFDFAVIE